MLFEEIITVYSEDHMKPTNALYGQNAESMSVTAGGTCSDHCSLKG